MSKSSSNLTKLSTDIDIVGDQSSSSTTTCLIPKNEIIQMEKLGEGSFAVVKRGIWKRDEDNNKKIDVAIKILRDDTNLDLINELQQEVNNMHKLQHPYLIRLYGIVFSNPAMMVVEYCDGGSLIDRLRNTDKPVMLVSLLVDYAQQIAKGMAYLESKHCVHRDLAARNVLLTDNERTIKICDFGLMRILNDNERLYVMSARKKVPFAWCPPESLRYRQFSHASDVWAFGVTLWEMFSYGEEPWAGCRGAEVLEKTEKGERLSQPLRCSNEIYDIMCSCWKLDAKQRPRFSLLKGLLNDIKFMIAEARETCSATKELDLDMKCNDRIIVVNGTGSIWYGQNVRTTNCGHFARSSIHAISERRRSTSSSSSINNHIERISKPIPGSFIHAGHGDINPSQSWGQPDRIDDIYLKNPILRNNNDLTSNRNGARPQIIPSVIEMNPPQSNTTNDPNKPIKKPKPLLPSHAPSSNLMVPPSSSTSYQSQSTIDPFAPFPDYNYDDFNYSSNIANDNQKQQPVFYDEPPPPSSSTTTQVAKSLPSTSNMENIILKSKSNNTTPPPIPPPPIINHPKINTNKNLQFASLPRPMRSSPDLSNINDIALKSRQRETISTSTIQRPSSSASSVLRTPLGNISEPPASLNLNQSFSISRQKSSDASSVLPSTSLLRTDDKKNDIIVTATTKTNNNDKNKETTFGVINSNKSTTTNNSSNTSNITDTKNDPFEVSSSVKRLANCNRYSQVFNQLTSQQQMLLPSPSPLFNSSSTTNTNTINSSSNNQLMNSNKQPEIINMNRSNQYAPLFVTSNNYNHHHHQQQQLPAASNNQFVYLSQQQQPIQSNSQPYYNISSSNQPFTNIATTSNINQSTFLYNANLSNRNSNPSSGILQPIRLSSSTLSLPSSSSQSQNAVNSEILGLFDPLLSSSSLSTTNQSSALETVVKNALFAGREKCAIKLKECNNNINEAISELKIDELLLMGITNDRKRARLALEDCNWDLNAAAAALLI